VFGGPAPKKILADSSFLNDPTVFDGFCPRFVPKEASAVCVCLGLPGIVMLNDLFLSAEPVCFVVNSGTYTKG
jgi:hypothetical protein